MTKLAAHVQESSDAVAEHLRRALYPAIKCMGNTTPAWLREKVLPEYDRCGVARPFIWRREHVEDGQWREWVMEGKLGAAKFFGATVRGYDDWRSVTDVVESGNEFIDWSDDDMKRLDECESELVRLYHIHGNRIIVGNFAVGWAKLGHWKLYGATLAHADFLGEHIYGWPEGFAPDDGAPFLWHPWRVLRFKKARECILAAGHRLPPVILTELGWDKALWQGGNSGFRNAPDPNAYYPWLTGFDARISADADVRYAAIFQTGAAADWRQKGFCIVGHYVGNTIADYTRADALQIPPETPPEPPSAGTLTDVERARLREFFDREVPATLKDAIGRSRLWVGQVPGAEHLYVSWDPAYGRYEINKLAMGTWEHLDDEPM